MYKIDSKVDKPSIKYLESRVKEMMQRGISIEDLQEVYNRFVAEQNEIAKTIRENYGILNPNSSKQIIGYMELTGNSEIYGICNIDGKWTTNKDAMWALSELGYDFASEILAYRKAKKYAESIRSMFDAVGSDGKVHPVVSLSRTNRINYRSPALMNIPKPLLWHIIKPNNPNNMLVSADIKNQEPSIMINILNTDTLKKALTSELGLYEYLFKEALKVKTTLHVFVSNTLEVGVISNDEMSRFNCVPAIYYTPSTDFVSSAYYNNEQLRYVDVVNVATTPGMEPKLPETVVIETVEGNQYEVKVEWDSYNKSKLKEADTVFDISGTLQDVDIQCEGIYRKEFKTAWNAMTYGASSFGIERMCKNINGKVVYQYFSKIPEFKNYRRMCNKLADKEQQYINTFFGTTLCAEEYDINKLKRVLMDLPIQGTAADILSLLVMHVDSEIKKRGLEGKLEVYFTRHDEIIFEVDSNWVFDEGIEVVKETIRDMTEHQIDSWIPFKVEVNEVEATDIFIDDSDDIE